ncbi:MAG: DUF4253 domain-containing protein [Bacteriodetes bacterium]|nr:DUF4253 domain-containing protein [Bacteroidota bacterium]
MMVKLTILLMGLFSIFGYGQKNSLTETEIVLLNKLTFSTELLTELKSLTESELKQLPAVDQETGEVLYNQFFNGVFTETSKEKAIEYVMKLKAKFRSKGYLVFIFQGEDNNKNVAVIKGTDDLDILRYRRTDGINYGLTNEKIVKRISEWKSEYGLIVVGCGRDWLQVEFDKLPSDIDAFANEVHSFCPNTVNQGVRTIDMLKKAIKEMKGLWLWWD